MGVRKIFKSYEFTFAGMPSSMYGLSVCDLGNKKHGDNSFGNKASIVETRIANRVTPIHYGVRYHDEPLSFTLIFGAEEELDRYQLQEVSMWLTGHQQYQWLVIDQPDLANVRFRCLIQELTPVSVGWLPVAFEAKVICDCPYGYSHPFEQSFQFDGETSIIIHNDSSCRERLKPTLHIELSSGCTSFTLENSTTGDKMELTGLPASGLDILIDNENGVMTENTYGYDLYDYFNFKFLSLAHGDNHMVVTGTGKLTVSGMYLYNVGA